MFEQVNEVFVAVAVKYMTATDVDPNTSNAHEIGGLKKAGMGQHLGMPQDGSVNKLQAEMAYIDDNEDVLISEGLVSWYDPRFKDKKRSPEWKLYYRDNEVTERVQTSDLMLIALTKSKKVLMLFCPQGSQSEAHIRSIFGAIDQQVAERFSSVDLSQIRIEMPIRLMLAKYGLQLDLRDKREDEMLELVVDRFGDRFPTTRAFSELARTLSDDVSARDDPDATLIRWMTDEESMFRIFERHIVQEKIDQGFNSVDDFLKVSLSIQNRRKSRVGYAFENHISEIFNQNEITYERGAVTELKKKPDFLFPCKKAYMDPHFDEASLFILGAKTTCKERWRQVLSEAKRVKVKHLITLEPSVSDSQTEEMRLESLQLVVPDPIQASYKPEQVEWLMNFREFIELVS